MREDRKKITEKKAKTVRLLILIITLVNAAVIGYTGSVFYSIIRTNVNMEDTGEYQYNVNNIFDPNDDTIDYYLYLNITNNGIYPIKFINLKVDVYIENSTNEVLLPPNTYFGTLTATFENIPAGNSSLKKVKIQIVAEIGIIIGLKTNDCWMRNEFEIQTQVEYFPINVSGIFFIFYQH